MFAMYIFFSVVYFLKGILFQRYDSSKVYYLQDPNEFPFQEGFDSIMIGCWWAVVTMSTVGYGDLVPKTGAGKVLGSAVVFLSMIFLALPMTIIVSKFSSCYDDLKYKDDDRYVSSDEEEEEDAEEVKA